MAKTSSPSAFRPEVVQGGIAGRTPGGSVVVGPPPYLRAVPSPAPLGVEPGPVGPVGSAAGSAESRQLPLRLIDSATLGIVDMRQLDSGQAFERLLRRVRPRVIFDVRPCPVFTLDHHWERGRAFALFAELDALYDDVTGRVQIETSADARLNPAWMGVALSELLAGHGRGGPILILLDGEERAADYCEVLPRYLKPAPAGGWTVLMPRDVG